MSPAAEAVDSAAVIAEAAPAVDCAVAEQLVAATSLPWLAGECLVVAAGERQKLPAQLAVVVAAAVAAEAMTCPQLRQLGCPKKRMVRSSNWS